MKCPKCGYELKQKYVYEELESELESQIETRIPTLLLTLVCKNCGFEEEWNVRLREVELREKE